ncbi:MAG: 30S ribosome-binding factor RbfA [candidate division Zixibacteria bacterium]|nr:30S ribosome-binding factor RbfA [candidate division Zixibacteria bacterium]
MAAVRRQDRLRDEIKKAVSEIIQTRMKDPHIGFVTVTDVELTKDLQFAKVFYSVYGDTTSQRETNRSLQKARGFIQSELGQRIRVRKLPTLQFEIDHSAERGMRIQELLNQIEKEDDNSRQD